MKHHEPSNTTIDTEEQSMPSAQATKLVDQIDPWWKLGGIVLAIVCGFIGATAWVHSEAQKAVLDEKFLQTLAARVRPTCVFNSQGGVEADLGAVEYIAEIHVKPLPERCGYEVTIKGKRHLAYAPLVTGLDVDLFPESASRGQMHDWKILLTPNSTQGGFLIAAGNGGMDTNQVHRFKLEILH